MEQRSALNLNRWAELIGEELVRVDLADPRLSVRHLPFLQREIRLEVNDLASGDAYLQL